MFIKLVDAHMHLADPDFNDQLKHIISFLRGCNVSIISNSMDLVTSRRTLELAEDLQGKILPFVGIHPWFAKESNAVEFEEIFLRGENKISGIGEIGLDKKYAKDEQAYHKQVVTFEKMLEYAEHYGKPVSVHSRGSQEEVIDVLSSFRIKKVLLHWFSGESSQLARAHAKGYFVSFGPTVIYSKRSRNLAQITPRESILVETDGPVRYSCFENKIAQPIFITSVVFALSFVLKLDFQETARLLLENTSLYIGRSL